MNAVNNKGNTALHFAYAYKYPDIVDFLENRGAKKDIVNDEGKIAEEWVKK
mgnify:CR=1 FL=1